MRLKFAVALALMLAPSAAIAEMQEGEVIGDWNIFSSPDTMTDRLSCAAFYKNQEFIQLSPGSLYIEYGGRGGWRFYKYRLGEGKPITGPTRRSAMRTYITFTGSVFEKAIEAGRLRVQTLTLIEGVVDEDIDLTGAAPVLAKMKEMGCNS